MANGVDRTCRVDVRMPELANMENALGVKLALGTKLDKKIADAFGELPLIGKRGLPSRLPGRSEWHTHTHEVHIWGKLYFQACPGLARPAHHTLPAPPAPSERVIPDRGISHCRLPVTGGCVRSFKFGSPRS